MFDTPYKRRGRGAQSNRSGRYESLQRMDMEDVLAEESATGLLTQWQWDTARRVITRNQSPDVPFDRSINPYRGCEHGCAYCFARPSHTWLGHSAGLDFERLLYAKKDAARLLRRELSASGYQCRPIAVGVNTDAYQPLERKLGITRQILEVLLEARHPCYLITKSSLIERDADLLSALSDRRLLMVSLSLTTLDNDLSHRLEPRAAAPHSRLRTMRRLADSGIPVRASIAPIIPGLNEHEIDALVEASAKAGATGANAIMLRLPHELSELFPEWLETHYPQKKAKVLNAIRSLRAGKLNDAGFNSRFTGQGPRAMIIRQRFEMACRRQGLMSGREAFRTDCSQFRAPAQMDDATPDSGQMSLF